MHVPTYLANAPRIGYRMELAILCEQWKVTKYRLGQILGIPNGADVYRYFSGKYVPAPKYLWRIIHLQRSIAEGLIDIDTFDPDTYWPQVDAYLTAEEEKETKYAQSIGL